MRGYFLFLTFLCFVFLARDGTTGSVGKKGKIEGESYVNLRSGPDLSHSPRAVLREGEEVTVEREEGSWYLVSLTDGKRGYVHKTFVRLFGKAEAKEVAKEKSVSQPAEKEKEDLRRSPPQQAERETPRSKPMPIIKVLEGKEWEILWWFWAALCIFIIGWICGGNYYLRRDRIRRKRLHF